MTEGKSEGRESPPETAQAGLGSTIPEAPPAGTAAHGAVAPVRATRRRRAAVAVLKGLANILFMALVIYVTYFFTMFFSTRPPAPATVPESARVAAKKIEEFRAEERRLLTTYGPANPVTRAVRIPIDRAMELVAADGTRPAPMPAAPPTSAPEPAAPKGELALAAPKAAATTGAPKAAAAIPVPTPATVPAPTPAPVGFTPAQLYRSICIQCHDVDGRGSIVRQAMPTIPDLTDPKWNASRTDADLQRSMLEGKGQFMLPMKDKFALTQIDPKDMVAFMRSFQPGKPAVATRTPAPSTPAPVVASAPTAPAAGSTSTPALTASPTTAPPAAPSPAPPASSSAAALALANASPIPNLNLDLNPILSPSALSTSTSATVLTPSSSRTNSAAPSPERAARLRAAGGFYNMNCVACHGPDGRGTIIRPAMPVIPDFTAREWQTGHENPQLAISILDGKGTLMPPWRGRVDPALAQDLVAFIRGFGPADLAAASASTTAFGTRIRQLRQQWQELDRQAQSLSGP
jgi:mono/diheme cytochrome c family protein